MLSIFDSESQFRMNTKVLTTNDIILDIYQNDDLENWIELFLRSCRARNLSRGTVSFYFKKLRVFLNYCHALAITEVSQITSETIREFMVLLAEQDHKPGGVHCFFRAVKAFLRWYELETDRTTWRNPINRVKAPFVPLELLNPVSIETVRSMIKAGVSIDIIDARDKAALLFLLDSGLRLSEFLALNKGDVDLVTGVVQVRCGKGRKPRLAYLGELSRRSLKRYLKERRDFNPALWVSKTGERLTDTGLRMMLRRRATRASVPIPSPHSFRRSFALERWRAGTDILTLSKLMGHSGLQVLSRYLKMAGEDLEQAARQTSPVDLNF